jgi:hypothetical protein
MFAPVVLYNPNIEEYATAVNVQFFPLLFWEEKPLTILPIYSEELQFTYKKKPNTHI